MPENKGTDFKTLLKFEGDAEGAKRAAEEAKQAVTSTSDATEKTQQAAASAADRQADSQREVAGATEHASEKGRDSAKTFDDVAKSFGTSESAANAFREALGRANPELAAMLDLGIKGPQIFDFFRSSLGRWVVAVVAGAGLAAAAFFKVRQELEGAAKAMEDLAAAEERRRQAARGQQEVAAEAAAAAGLPVEATDKLRAVMGRLVAAGFEEPAAATTAAATVGPTGEQLVTDEQLHRLAGGVQSGRLAIPTGAEIASPEQRQRALDQALRDAYEGPQAEEIANATRQFLAARQREMSEALAGRETEVRTFIEQRTGLTGEPLEEMTAAARRRLRQEPIYAIRPDGGDIMPAEHKVGREYLQQGGQPVYFEDWNQRHLGAKLDQLEQLVANMQQEAAGASRRLNQAPAGDQMWPTVNNFGTVVMQGPKTRPVRRRGQP